MANFVPHNFSMSSCPSPNFPRTTLHSHLREVLESLSTISPTDPINECPASTLAVLTIDPAAVIKLAIAKIHSHAFSNVPICWRRLYTDASIHQAVNIIREELGRSTNERLERCEGVKGTFTGKRKMISNLYNSDEEDWMQKVVRLLDMAVIMCGAPQREAVIEKLLLALQRYVEESQSTKLDSPETKRRKTSDIPVSGIEDEFFLQHPIPKYPDMSILAFEKHLQNTQPLVIQNFMAHWPALHQRSWKSQEYLMERTFGGRRLIPIEIGRNYTDEGWSQKIVTFKDFMENYLTRTNLNDEKGSDTAYLAQHDLFAQIPSLRNDISVPDYCYTDPPAPDPASKKPSQTKLEEPFLNAWLGHAGTVSTLHTDPYHNILCQVVGKKYIRLYSPGETEKLYPKGVERGGIDMSNTSEVDVEGDSVEHESLFPLFQKAKYVETILCEGECLYIPVGWWHYVRSLTVSFSVSFWWN